MSEAPRFTAEQARDVGVRIGVDWATAPFDVEQFRMGLDVELEHGSREPATDVTGDDPITTGRIALAHLNEFPDYYTRLARMEAEARSAGGGGGQLAGPRAGDEADTLNRISARFRDAGFELRLYESAPGAWDAMWHPHGKGSGQTGTAGTDAGTASGATAHEAAERALWELEARGGGAPSRSTPRRA